jgi:membrane-bound ClpP family serine protease
MTLPILLVIAGLLLIYFEFFLPGGIMGIFGAMLMIAGVILLATTGVSPFTLFIFVALSALLLFFTIKFALIRVKKTGSKGTMFLNDDQTGYYASKYNKELVEKEGIASSDLKPSGYIKIEDNIYQAVSKTGYIEKGSPIKVIGGRGAYLICKQIK